MTKPKIYAFNVFYLPGFKGGGSIRALEHLISHLRDDFDFEIFTIDHDLGSEVSYPESERQDTIKKLGYPIHYFHGFWGLLLGLKRAVHAGPSLIYLNSCFAPFFSIWPIICSKFGAARKTPILLAPRGELMTGALQSKSLKKCVFLYLAKISNFFKNIPIHVTSGDEKSELIAIGLKQGKIYLAKDLPPKPDPSRILDRTPKRDAHLNLLFVSRIDPKKNLLFALECLLTVKSSVKFSIVGPVVDYTYWGRCLEIIKKLPENIEINYLGPIPFVDLPKIYASNDLFFFPTLGENNGYVIPEALIAGCPTLISNLTPWLNLESLGVGQDLPLTEPLAFSEALDRWADMSTEDHLIWSKRASAFGKASLESQEEVDNTRKMFLEVIESQTS